MIVGVVSDTHGFFDPRIPPLLEGVEHILHGGDIGSEAIIHRLGEIAPVTAVRGNNDREGLASMYSEQEVLELGGCRILLTHAVKVPKEGSPDLARYTSQGVDVVVYGHSHIAFQESCGGVLFFNPGAAGKRRFKVVPSIGLLELQSGSTLVKGTVLPL